MLPVEVVNLLMAFGGFLVGSFLPLAVVYIGIYIKKHKLNWKTFFGFILRVVAVPVVFALLFVIVGLTLELAPVGPEGFPEVDGGWFVVPLFLGFLGGVAALVYGVIKGIQSAKHRRGHPQVPS